MAEDKQYLRRILSEARRAMPPAVAVALSGRLQAILLESEPFRSAARIVAYAAVDNEASLEAAIAEAWRSGRSVFLPVVRGGSILLAPTDDSTSLSAGAFGIPEPTSPTVPSAGAIGPALLCVPGLGFTRAGDRLGRGGGYYDRLIAEAAPGMVTVGLAYSFQLLDSIPVEGHDQRLDYVVTECAVYASGQARRPLAHPANQGGTPRWTY